MGRLVRQHWPRAAIAGSSTAVLALALGAALGPAPAASGSSGVKQTVVAGAVTYLYVAERGAGAVGVYRSDSSGAASPVRTLVQTGADGYPTDAWDVALDAQGRLFVQNFLSESPTRVYAAGARGPATPLRVFRGYARDSPALAVAPDGTTYVARAQPDEVDVFPPGASGQLSPRVLDVDGLPRGLTVDPAGELVVAVERGSAGNSLEVFAPGATGSAAPLRTVAGPHTGLGASAGYVGSADQVVVTSSALTHRIYVAVSGGPAEPGVGIPALATHVSVFAEDATGDATPVRTISGPATGLAGSTLSGIADNPASGNIWVMASVGSTARVLDFARLGSGNVAPVRSFTDAVNRFADVQGIAFGTR